jgi:DNA polymerase-3 subunit epsilon
LGFDLETTGIDRFSDVPVSYALVRVEGAQVVQRDTWLVDPGREIPDGATAIHGITTARARGEGIPLNWAVDVVADALVDACSRGIPVVGMNLDYDLTIMDVQCRRLDGRGLTERGWDGPVLDALVIDRRFDRYRKGHRTLGDLCQHYDVRMDRAHEAMADAEAAVGAVLAMCEAFPELQQRPPRALHEDQIEWHREWAESYDRWRSEQDLEPLDPREYDWPIANEAIGMLVGSAIS